MRVAYFSAWVPLSLGLLMSLGCAPTPSTSAPTAASPTMPSDVQVFTVDDVTDTTGMAPTASDVLPWVTNFSQFPVAFQPGFDQAAYTNDLSTTDAHTYEVQAQAEQILEINLLSLGNQAELAIFAPTGVVMVQEAAQAVVQLPMDGSYTVVVATPATTERYSINIQVTDP